MHYSITSLDPERLLSLFGMIAVLSLLVERALAVLFESRATNEWLSRRSLKEPIAVTVSLGLCMRWDIDVITALGGGGNGQPDFWGQLITACIVAGGSKASIKLFRDVLGVRSNAESRRITGGPPEPSAPSPQT